MTCGLLLVAFLAVAGCGGDGRVPTVRPSTAATSVPRLTPEAATNIPGPTPTLTPESSFLPLPDDLGRVPGAADPSAELIAQTPSGELTLGEARNYLLGHCGLISPIDIDGSLWDPIGGHNGAGGPLTEDQQGDLINATPTTVVLIDAQTMEMLTSHGALVTLTRHDGPRRYFLCD